MDPSEIKTAVLEALSEHGGIDHEVHRVHHDYLQRRLERDEKRERRREELYDKIKATVVGALIVAVISFAGTMLYNVGKFVIDLYQHSQPPTH